MRDIDSYTEEALREPSNKIENYKRKKKHGVIEVKYDLIEYDYDFIQYPGELDYYPLISRTTKSHYFDSGTGQLLGNNKNQAFEKLNKKGIQLLEDGNYDEAAKYCGNAYLGCSSGYKNEKTFKKNRDKAEAEVDAADLNSEGDKLYKQGKYSEAEQKYQEAYDQSNVSKEYEKYKANRDKAEAEADAKRLNSEGDYLFIQGNFLKAACKYQEAYDTSNVRKEYNKYKVNRDKAESETYAKRLNSEGDYFFWHRNFLEAVYKYQEAYNTSNVREEYNKYKVNRNKAQTALDAINLNDQGYYSIIQGEYSEAQRKYQEACDKTKVNEEFNKFKENRDKVQVEVDAINLNSEGDNLFKQGKYSEAPRKYQAASDKSNVSKEYDKYKENREKCQTIINKLVILDTLWNEAWDAENDIDNDRSSNAQEIFQRILNESKDNLKIFPGNLKFKQYETLAALKIEGNELFNEGLECHQNGIVLLQAAQRLNQQQKYALANIKFKDAKCKFSAALEKFNRGSQNDQRFFSCIEFVQEQIRVVTQSIATTEQHKLSEGFSDLSINIGNDKSNTDVYDSKKVVTEQHDYYQQI